VHSTNPEFPAMSRARSLLRIAAVLGVAVMLSGCVIVPEHHHHWWY
jgi:hypothetical protein